MWGVPEDVKHEGVGSRIFGAIRLCVGLTLFAGTLVLMGWNESRAVHAARAVEADLASVVEVPCSPISRAVEGKLVHLTCEVGSVHLLADPPFQVAIPAIQMHRTVEMFQYMENRDSLPNGTIVYTYSTGWNSTLIDSSHFKVPNGCVFPGSAIAIPCVNPPWPLPDVSQFSANAKAGDFVIPPSLIEETVASRRLTFHPVWPTPATWNFVPSAVQPPPTVTLTQTQRLGEWLWTSQYPARPQVGELRLRWEASSPSVVSILAEQTGGTLRPWKASGRLIFLLREGKVSAIDMLADSEGRNMMATWATRVGGFLMCWLGLHMIVSTLATIPNLIPCIGILLSDLERYVLCYLTCASGLALSALVVGTSWVALRPLTGVPLLAGAVAIWCGVCWMVVIPRSAMRAIKKGVVGGGLEVVPSTSPWLPMTPLPPTLNVYPLSVSPESRPPNNHYCCARFAFV
eukprot:RCo016339